MAAGATRGALGSSWSRSRRAATDVGDHRGQRPGAKVYRTPQVGLRGTELAQAQVSTVRVRLLKCAGVVGVSVRRIVIALSSVFPLQGLFARVLANLQQAYPRRC